MDTAQPPQTWDELLHLLQQRQEGTLISYLYSFAAEENGRSFEELDTAIAQVLQHLGFTPEQTLIDTIWQSAPLLF